MSGRFTPPSARVGRGGRAPRLAPLLLSLSLCLASGCRREAAPPQADQPNRNTAAPAQQTAAGAADGGDLKLHYQARKSHRARPATHEVGGDRQALEKLVADLNERIALPWDIAVTFEDCDEANAFYDPETRKLVMCHELVDEYYDLFSHKIKDKGRLDAAVRGATVSTFYHELGHALIDAWRLPVTGKEEDAVDQLSTLVLIDRAEEGEQMALDGAVSFMLYAELGKGQEKIYWDEHSLDEQRFYDTVCLVYGHNPDKYTYLVADGTLPAERAELCREDYPRVSDSWAKLLAPYLKQPPPSAGEASPK